MSSPAEPRGNQRLLAVWVLYVATLTLFPFDFRWARNEFQEPMKALWVWAEVTRSEVVSNVLMFIPLGALLYERGHPRLSGRALIFGAGSMGLLISAAIECLQAFLPRRDTALVDVFSNTAGAMVGALVARGFGATLRTRVAPVVQQYARAASVSALIVFSGVAMLASGALQIQTRLSNWDANYPLLIGNEETGDRPWRGRLFALELTEASTPSVSMQRFSEGASITLPGRRIAAYDFSGSPPYKDATGTLPNLNWTAQPMTAASSSGIRLQGQSWLRSDGPAFRLTDRVRQTNAFTLRISCAADDANQWGPARIISNSVDIGLRNFMLGQHGQDMVFRFRTPHNGLNGARPQVIVPAIFANNERREILVTYDGASLLAAVAGSGRVHRTESTPGSSLALAYTSLEIGAGELWMLKFMYLVSVFFLPGVLIAFLTPNMNRRAMFGVMWVLVFTMLLESTLVLSSGRPFDWHNVTATALVGTVVVAVAASLCGGSATTSARGAQAAGASGSTV